MTRFRIAALPILVIAIIMVVAATVAGIRDGLQGWSGASAVIGTALFFAGVALAARGR